MLTISAAQLKAFQRPALDNYASALAARLRREGHASWKQRADLKAVVHRSVLWAWEYELRTERELRAFVELALFTGEHFHAYPAIHEILTSEEEDKIGVLGMELAPHQWLEAEVFSRAVDSGGKEERRGH
ncbi:MAG: hypothetical protein JNL62_21630 [Bryobacterales bacterium]|nr:hypothetical protein [Bryobacterales bacterium]